MRADQLRSAAGTIAELLNKSDVLTSIRQRRDAQSGAELQASHARLTQSAKLLLRGVKGFSSAEQEVASQLHLSSIGSLDYWQALLNQNGDTQAQHAELVQLYSRVMFASSHLPSLAGLLSTMRSAPAAIETRTGESSLVVKLTDAGEKASDPDRLARAIDGIDMIYSASVSLSRRPAIDLQLREITGHPDKHLVFLGDQEGVAALYTVLDSIPDALENLDAHEDIDLAALVRTLPIFDDLTTLADVGNLSHTELRDIDDTMHQGIMLTLESGVVVEHAPPPVDPERGVTTLSKRANNNQPDYQRPDLQQPDLQQQNRAGYAPRAEQNYAAAPARQVPMNNAVHAGNAQAGQAPASAYQGQPQPQASQNPSEQVNGSAEKDEYYQQYLQERERLRNQPLSDEEFDRSRVSPPGDREKNRTGLLKGFTRNKNR